MDDYKSFENGDKIVKGVLCILCCVFFLIVVFFGCCTVACCKNCCCGILFSFFSFVFGIILVAIGVTLYTQTDRI